MPRSGHRGPAHNSLKKAEVQATKSSDYTSVYLYNFVVHKTDTGANYRTFNRNAQLLIDTEFAEGVIPANDSVHFAAQIVAELNFTPLYRAYKRRGRKPAANPSTMLKVVLYAAEELFYEAVSKPGELWEIKFEHLFVDGTKSKKTTRRQAKNKLSPCGLRYFSTFGAFWRLFLLCFQQHR